MAKTPIVGIGASAGGLEALKALVTSIPRDLGACYVIVQHLAPDQETIMDQLLQKKAPIPVTQIEDREYARPDHIYIVPPGKTLQVDGDRFVLTGRTGERSVFRPIDMFLRSLAEARERDAYCVILSGTGTDGSEGLKAVKARGGFALVQESTGARFPGMPDSAVATGLVDFVLPAHQIARRLREIIQHRRRLTDDNTRDRMRADALELLPDINTRLAEVSGNDFSEYKPGTLVRRIERRMALLRIDSVDTFLDILQQDQTQAELLAQEFLIGVTRFFRDPAAWQALRETVVRPLLEKDQGYIRVWCPGCSTGEEAYTVAMIFLEEMEARKSKQILQVFGTDIDVAALVTARVGLFSPAAIDHLGEHYREKYFAIDNAQFRAVPSLRESIVFAPHNLVQDPPFSRLDLITCRNLMIYLSAELQARVLPRMHFALRRDGYLFLGPSETVGDDEDLFLTSDRTHKIFARNDDTKTKYSALSDPLPRVGNAPRRIPRSEPLPMPAAHNESAREAIAEREFLQRFAAPYALITAAGDITYMSEGMTAFVQPSAGTPSNNIDAYLRRELRLPIRTALKQAQNDGEIVEARDIMLDEGDSTGFVDIQLGPTRSDPNVFLIAVNRVRTIEQGSVDSAVKRRESIDQDMLEAENFNLRRQLSAALQEFETSGQELKSTNEELLSMNEELQSSNEELETSREELQSINEELETVNAELQENNRLLTRANSDLKNLFESTDVAVLFLDRNFCVRNFTPATTRLFGIRKRDIGRPISDLSSKMDYPGLAEDAQEVNDSLQGLEREVRIAASGETFLLRIKPYRTTENVIDGYVLSFVDITRRKNFEETLQHNERELGEQYAELENLYDTTPVGLCLQDRELRFVRINKALAEINGFPVEDHIGKTIHEVFGTPDETVVAKLQSVLDTGKAILDLELEVETPGAGRREYKVDYYPVRNKKEVFAVGACVRDVTDQNRLRAELAESEGRLKRLFDASPVYIAITEGPDHVYTYSNPPHDAICGHRDLLGKPILEAMPELAGQGIVERFDEVYKSGQAMRVPEFKAMFDRDGDGEMEEAWFMQTLEPILDGAGNVSGVATFAYEISEVIAARNAAEASDVQKTLLLGELQHRVKNTLATINAISKLLLRGESDAVQYQQRLALRLQAIARAHDLLTRSDWQNVSLNDLLATELAAYITQDSDRYIRRGPNVMLAANNALSVAMALHELATNAAKYGALSVEAGQVIVETSETRDGDGTRWITLHWQERGGPGLEKAPDRKGFGSMILEKVLTQDLGGEVRNQFTPEGLSFQVTFKYEDET